LKWENRNAPGPRVTSGSFFIGEDHFSPAGNAGGRNYQALINDALLEHIARRREPLESTIRRVIREELRRAG